MSSTRTQCNTQCWDHLNSREEKEILLNVWAFGSHLLEGLLTIETRTYSPPLWLSLIRGETTSMSVSMVTQDNADSGVPPEESDKKVNGGPNGLTIETKNLLWRMSTRRFDTSRPEWIYGQLAINSEIAYRVRPKSQRTDERSQNDLTCFADPVRRGGLGWRLRIGRHHVLRGFVPKYVTNFDRSLSFESFIVSMVWMSESGLIIHLSFVRLIRLKARPIQAAVTSSQSETLNVNEKSLREQWKSIDSSLVSIESLLAHNNVITIRMLLIAINCY